MRVALAFGLGAAVLAVGLATAWVSNANHARARRLDLLQRECEQLWAVRARLRAQAAAHVPGVADPLSPTEQALAERSPSAPPGAGGVQ